MNEKEKAIIQNIKNLKYYGVKKQMPIWIEEMSELIKEVCKWARDYDKLDGDINLQLLFNLKEEITDVTICLDQLKSAIQFTEDELIKEYKWKVDRQAKRIASETHE